MAQETYTCGVCGRPSLSAPPTILYAEEGTDYISICPICSDNMGTCNTCANSLECNFQSCSNAPPHFITKETHFGPFI